MKKLFLFVLILAVILGVGGGVLFLKEKEKTPVLFSSFFSRPFSSPTPAPPPQPIKIIFGGDLMFDRNIRLQAEKAGGYDFFFTNLASLFQEADLVGLKMGQALGINKQKLFSLTNSGEVTGEEERAVGYAALGFWLNAPKAANGSKKDDTKEKLSRQEKEMLLSQARQALENYFEKGKILDEPPPTLSLAQKRGVFVTLKKNGQLRGCIGDFSANEPLWEKVKKMALAAAFDDPRFSPLSPEELDEIKIEISVLSPLKKINSVEEIEMGKHGVYLKYGQKAATFLPQVAEETGWSREEFLANLCVEKAGLPADCWRNPEIELFTYTAEVFSEE